MAVPRPERAREPQLITVLGTAGADDAYPNVEVRPKAEHIPSAAIFEAALVARVFEYDVTIEATGEPCAVAQTYLLMHAIERAVWNAIRATVPPSWRRPPPSRCAACASARAAPTTAHVMGSSTLRVHPSSPPPTSSGRASPPMGRCRRYTA